MQVNVTELKALHPKMFEWEYRKWCEHKPYDDWWATHHDYFNEKHADAGVDADSIEFTLFRRGGGAAFVGRVDMATFMKHMKLDEKYLPLYLAIADDGSRAAVRTSNYGDLRVSLDGAPWDTGPSGVFSALSQADWEELIEEQWGMACLEEAVEAFCKDICDELLTALEEDYDYLTSEKAFIESCEANETTFEIETEGEDE